MSIKPVVNHITLQWGWSEADWAEWEKYRKEIQRAAQKLEEEKMERTLGEVTMFDKYAVVPHQMIQDNLALVRNLRVLATGVYYVSDAKKLVRSIESGRYVHADISWIHPSDSHTFSAWIITKRDFYRLGLRATNEFGEESP